MLTGRMNFSFCMLQRELMYFQVFSLCLSFVCIQGRATAHSQSGTRMHGHGELNDPFEDPLIIHPQLQLLQLPIMLN